MPGKGDLDCTPSCARTARPCDEVDRIPQMVAPGALARIRSNPLGMRSADQPRRIPGLTIGGAPLPRAGIL